MEPVNTATTVETEEGKEGLVQTTTTLQEPFIVGANSVYPDVASLFEGAKQKEAFIDTLKSEKKEQEKMIAELQQQVKALQNVNRFKEELKMTEQQPTVIEPTSQLTEEKVQELALKTLQQQKEQEMKQSNMEKSMQVVSQAFGAEAENKLESKCKELGLSKDFVMSVAQSSPKAFLNMLGLEEPTQVSIDSLIAKGRTASVQQTQVQSDDWYTDLQKNPSKATNKGYLQSLFKEGLKNPEKILSSYQPWEV